MHTANKRNRSRTAHNLLSHLCNENSVDIVLISEQYQEREGSEGWFLDRLDTMAIWIHDSCNFCVMDGGFGRGFVWIRLNNYFYVGVYLTTNELIN